MTGLWLAWTILLGLVGLVWVSRHLDVSRYQRREHPLTPDSFDGPPTDPPPTDPPPTDPPPTDPPPAPACGAGACGAGVVSLLPFMLMGWGGMKRAVRRRRQ